MYEKVITTIKVIIDLLAHHENYDRPGGITLSITDATDTPNPKLFMAKEAGYEEWIAMKVDCAVAALDEGSTTLTPHDEVFDKLWAKMRAKHPGRFA